MLERSATSLHIVVKTNDFPTIRHLHMLERSASSLHKVVKINNFSAILECVKLLVIRYLLVAHTYSARAACRFNSLQTAANQLHINYTSLQINYNKLRYRVGGCRTLAVNTRCMSAIPPDQAPPDTQNHTLGTIVSCVICRSRRIGERGRIPCLQKNMGGRWKTKNRKLLFASRPKRSSC